MNIGYEYKKGHHKKNVRGHYEWGSSSLRPQGPLDPHRAQEPQIPHISMMCGLYTKWRWKRLSKNWPMLQRLKSLGMLELKLFPIQVQLLKG